MSIVTALEFLAISTDLYPLMNNFFSEKLCTLELTKKNCLRDNEGYFGEDKISKERIHYCQVSVCCPQKLDKCLRLDFHINYRISGILRSRHVQAYRIKTKGSIRPQIIITNSVYLGSRDYTVSSQLYR